MSEEKCIFFQVAETSPNCAILAWPSFPLGEGHDIGIWTLWYIDRQTEASSESSRMRRLSSGARNGRLRRGVPPVG